MLQSFLEVLIRELNLDLTVKPNKEKIFPLRLTKEIEVGLRDLEPGVSMQAKICPCPVKRREDLFIYLMRANFLGQGTGGSRIGLDPDEKFLTLSLGLPYEMNYRSFKENMEDFVNYLVLLREEVTKFENEETIL